MRGENLKQEIQERYFVETPDQATALLNPLRAEILAKLKEPSSAAEVARMIKEPSQKVNYHVKNLEKVGLVKRVGTRNVRNLVEILYQSIAKTFVLSESLGWEPETVKKIKDQGSLKHLITTSERIKRDAFNLLELSDQKEVIPSATLDMTVKLENEVLRKEFVQEYVTLMKTLVNKYQTSQSHASERETYSVVVAIYPQTMEGEGQDE
jgi:DNA-binding transcriptional ArsR family regulator